MMAAKTGSDGESDEEFGERTSDELSRFYFGTYLDAVAQLENELGKKRFDRVKKIVEIENVLRPGQAHLILRRLINAAHSQHMLAAGCPETLQFIFSHFGDNVSEHAQKKMLLQAALYGSDDSVDTLHSFVGDSFVQKVSEEVEQCGERSKFCCNLLHASKDGDLLEVERCLAVEGAGLKMCCPHTGEHFAKAAAMCGQTQVVQALLTWQFQRNVGRSVKRTVAWQTRRGAVDCVPKWQSRHGCQHALGNRHRVGSKTVATMFRKTGTPRSYLHSRVPQEGHSGGKRAPCRRWSEDESPVVQAGVGECH